MLELSCAFSCWNAYGRDGAVAGDETAGFVAFAVFWPVAFEDDAFACFVARAFCGLARAGRRIECRAASGVACASAASNELFWFSWLWDVDWLCCFGCAHAGQIACAFFVACLGAGLATGTGACDLAAWNTLFRLACARADERGEERKNRKRVARLHWFVIRYGCLFFQCLLVSLNGMGQED